MAVFVKTEVGVKVQVFPEPSMQTVSVGVVVGLLVGVWVGELLGLFVGLVVKVLVGDCVGLLEGVEVGELVAVGLGVLVAVWVNVRVGVQVLPPAKQGVLVMVKVAVAAGAEGAAGELLLLPQAEMMADRVATARIKKPMIRSFMKFLLGLVETDILAHR